MINETLDESNQRLIMVPCKAEKTGWRNISKEQLQAMMEKRLGLSNRLSPPRRSLVQISEFVSPI